MRFAASVHSLTSATNAMRTRFLPGLIPPIWRDKYEPGNTLTFSLVYNFLAKSESEQGSSGHR